MYWVYLDQFIRSFTFSEIRVLHVRNCNLHSHHTFVRIFNKMKNKNCNFYLFILFYFVKILHVHAEDGDKGNPREIRYGLVSEGNPFTSFFNINETTGKLFFSCWLFSWILVLCCYFYMLKCHAHLSVLYFSMINLILKMFNWKEIRTFFLSLSWRWVSLGEWASHVNLNGGCIIILHSLYYWWKGKPVAAMPGDLLWVI